MKKGKLLEITLRIVQESLKDKADTEILSNYQLTNSSGRKREFDIVIKANLNGFDFYAVIECKDYKKPVSVEKIEAFNSKCLRIPQISKKIFVSKNGFQADAINAAKYFGIEIYDLEEIGKDLVKDWLSVSMVIPMLRYLQLKQVKLWTDKQIPTTEFNLNSILYHRDQSWSSTARDFIIGLIKQLDIQILNFQKDGTSLARTDTFGIQAESIEDLFFLSSEEVKYNLTRIYVVFSLISEELPSRVIVEKIKSIDKEMSTVITHDTDGPDIIKLVLKGGNPNKFDSFIVNKETGKVRNLGYSIEYKKIEGTE